MHDAPFRVAAATPTIRVADCSYNAARVIELIKKAEAENIRLICMSALCLTGSTCGDLFLQKALLDGAMNALCEIGLQTSDCKVIAVIGMPTLRRGEVFSAAAVLCEGRLLGMVTESGAFEHNGLKFGVELGGVSCGADDVHVVANPCAEPEIVGARARRCMKIATLSAKPPRVYVSANAGAGESTTDSVFAGHNLICQNGRILAESPPFGDAWVVAEIDPKAPGRGRVPAPPPREDSPFFYTNIDEIPEIQAHGLAKRLAHTGANAVLGISGGLDSTLALLVTVRAYEILARDKSEIIAVTMPCFGTTARTKSNAKKLCDALGVPIRKIDITKTTKAHLRDIAHPSDARDTTFENAQARVRTLVLMSLANQNNGLVVGSGNLSELALGFTTFGGDHLSMYGVNSGVPKTVVRKIVEHFAEKARRSAAGNNKRGERYPMCGGKDADKNSPHVSSTCAGREKQSPVSGCNPALAKVLADILATPISPELLPPQGGEIVQRTEDILGSYELHDFFLWYMLNGRTPASIFALAKSVFEGKFTSEEISRRQKIFYSRFFSQQFKRNCLPDGPKVFSVSLSPRAYNMPSDAVDMSLP
ncbi:MAG: NAD(+) synthase [Defluviitaleaceae bacterium]|nr:NAD(+) synthase [Defluviitaleaceae bacterium]